MSEPVTTERLRYLLAYDSESGVFIWKVSTAICVTIGKVAGCKDRKSGYRIITIDHRSYLAHRLAWFYMTGNWPAEQIDHINGVKDDNRFSNLRECDVSQNSSNIGMRKTNTSGFKGAVLCRRDGRWRSEISVRGKAIFLGYYDTPEAAHAAYAAASKKYHGEFSRTE